MLSCQVLTLVLEEDGTVVDSEDFFQTVPSSAALMVLDKGELWTRSKVSIRLSHTVIDRLTSLWWNKSSCV